MEEKILSDPAIEPNEALLFTLLGNTQLLWHELMAYLHQTYSGVDEVWRYYKDGNRWLFRALRKKQTIFWINVQQGYFRVAFYISQSAESKILEGDFAEEAKIAFQEGRKIGKTQEVVVDMRNKDDLELAKKLIDIRMKIKY